MKIQVDAFVKIQSTFSDMVIQSFLKWGGGGGGGEGGDLGDICPFSFRNMGYFTQYLKGYGVPWTPFLCLNNQF